VTEITLSELVVFFCSYLSMVRHGVKMAPETNGIIHWNKTARINLLLEPRLLI